MRGLGGALHAEGPGALYATVLGSPQDGVVKLEGLAPEARAEVHMLGLRHNGLEVAAQARLMASLFHMLWIATDLDNTRPGGLP